MLLIEVRPTNPQVTTREFISFGDVARLYRDDDGLWAGLTHDGLAFVVADDWVRYLEVEIARASLPEGLRTRG